MLPKHSIFIILLILVSIISLQITPQIADATSRQTHVTAWGANNVGQTAVPVGLTNVVKIAAGGNHSLALKSNGTVVAWGANNSRQSTVPLGLSNVIAIAAGGSHSLAVKSNRTVVAWGANNSRQSTVPLGLSNVIAIAAGNAHSLALKSNRTVVAWGNNSDGQSTVPTDLSNVIAIAASRNHSLALKSNGTVVAWGDNYWGQTSVPASLSNVIAIATGSSHSLALKSNGTIVAWGASWAGQTNVPPGLKGVIAIAAGGTNSLALTANGKITRWGLDLLEQYDIPLKSRIYKAEAIAAGNEHIVVINKGEPIKNTSFESGATAWNQGSIVRTNIVQNIPPIARTGSWVSILGNFGNENMSLSQRIYVPDFGGTLSFHYKFSSTETCGRFFDTARVYVANQVLWKLDACRYQVTPRWQIATINLKRFAGQHVELRFNMTTNGTNHSAWFIDDIGWR